MQNGPQVAESKSGIPTEHSAIFSRVARQTNTIIASRAVGVYATGLIREGYATKGYHVKAKSCNWGPMAGFVLADPALGKKGRDKKAKAWQLKKINLALKAGATMIPLVISDRRRQALPKIMAKEKQYYEAQPEKNGIINIWSKQKANSKTVAFILIKVAYLSQQSKPIGAKGTDWAVCYSTNSQLSERCEKRFYKEITLSNPSPNPYLQLCALSDPRGDIANAPFDYKAAQTGDYDLWGVFPKITRKTAKQKYIEKSVVQAATNNKKSSFWQRDVEGSDKFVRTYAQYAEQEGEHTGNLSLLIEEIAVRVNAGCMINGRKSWVIHHSDEAGRPMVDEVDADAVVYFPNGEIWVMSDLADVRTLRNKIIRLGYRPLFNPIWEFKLGIRQNAIRNDWLLRNTPAQFPVDIR